MRRGENRTTKTTLCSERSSALKKGLTGPTLLEMSDYRVDRVGKLAGRHPADLPTRFFEAIGKITTIEVPL
jgi:hypothetical protein